MKIKIIVLSIFIIILFISCNSPESPKAAIIDPLNKVILEINGEVTKTNYYGKCQITGYIKNTGHATAYESSAVFKIYSDIDKTIEIPTWYDAQWKMNCVIFDPAEKESFRCRTIESYPCEDVKALEIIIEYNPDNSNSSIYVARQSQTLTYIFD